MKKTYYVQFFGYCAIKAESQKEAVEKFWDNVTSSNDDTYFEIDNIEVKENKK